MDKSDQKRLRLFVKDRRRAAIHEAGHITMAWHMGLLTFGAEIHPTCDPKPFDRLWVGQTECFKLTYAARKATLKQIKMFSIAGIVAELCWDRQSFEDTLNWDCWFDPEIMSPSDWEGAGCAPGEPPNSFFKHVAEVFVLFERESGRLWPNLLKASRWLILKSRAERNHWSTPDRAAVSADR